MGDKITYILGAGASIGKFPLVKGTKSWNDKGLSETLEIEGEVLLHNASIFSNNDRIRKVIAKGMITTGKAAKLFGNIDTYAKYLYHKKMLEELKLLKLALTYYFVRGVVCNSHNEFTEKRYLNFITSIITDEGYFPDHVKVLSWNYDYLLEAAAMWYYRGTVEYTDTGVGYSPPLVNYYPHPDFVLNPNAHHFFEKYNAVHLNGLAGLYLAANSLLLKNVIQDLLGKDYNNKVDENAFLRSFEEDYSGTEHLITFAWEKTSATKNILRYAEQITETVIKGTTTLVVIGYSFPFYNREIDNAIFNVMEPTLQKIYFQDPYVSGDFLRKRYDLRKEGDPVKYKYPGGGTKITLPYVDIEHITNSDQFYVPIEL